MPCYLVASSSHIVSFLNNTKVSVRLRVHSLKLRTFHFFRSMILKHYRERLWFPIFWHYAASIPAWLKWGFWVSPISYGEIGLSLNEFLAPRWQKVRRDPLILSIRYKFFTKKIHTWSYSWTKAHWKLYIFLNRVIFKGATKL